MSRLNEELKICISPEDKKRIRIKMEGAGILNMSANVQKMALDGICVRLDLDDVRQLIILLQRCNNNLNQYGYIADPDNKNHLLPDPETAYVVRQIFAMYVRGDRICDIQDWLKDNEIVTVAELRYRRTGSCRHPRPRPDCIYNWPQKTITDILSRTAVESR